MAKAQGTTTVETVEVRGITQINKWQFSVPSNSEPNKRYTVTYNPTMMMKFHCYCNSFSYRGTCRHVDDLLEIVEPIWEITQWRIKPNFIREPVKIEEEATI